MSAPTNAPIHISVVLDRSGSMATIADDIVGGFNEYLAEQRQVEGRVRVTLAQFDSQDPFEVLINGVDLREVTDLDRSSYRPRGGTPLFDAIGRMIAKIDADSAARTEVGAPEEDQVVLIVTDGLENASREHSRQMIFDLIEARRGRGWVFVFLGANQDAYAEGRTMAFSQANSGDWAASPEGSKQMWKDLSYSTSAHRAKTKQRRIMDEAEFLKRRRGN
jgi:Mg-chelatase subunit ChlD